VRIVALSGWAWVLVGLVACGDPSSSTGAGGAGSTGNGASGSISSATGTTTAASASGTATGTASTGTGSPSVALPPANEPFDYQLGGAYPPPAGVKIVSRDRNAPPAGAGYDICYVNGYQSQPDESMFWLSGHPDLVLRDGNGQPVMDPVWNEMLLDITTSAKRAALADVVGGWIDGCAAAGFQAVEIDNLDTYSRSTGLITQDDAVAFMQLLSARAHADGLAIAQKNASEIVARKSEMGTDFAVAEECDVYSECDVYTGGYGDRVLVIEYTQAGFSTGCASFPQLSIVLRDVNLVTPSDSGYVYQGC
jgi:hypothetical protein